MKKVLLPIAFAVSFFAVGATLNFAAAESIPYTSVPDGAPLSSADMKWPAMPSSLASTERVPGIFVAAPSSAQRKSSEARGYYYASVFGNEESAKAYSAGKTAPSASATTRVCFGTSHDSGSDPSLRLVHVIPVAPSSASARPGQAARPPAPVVAKKPPSKPLPPPVKKPSVRVVHMEKLNVIDAANASLEVTDAWVDVLSLGARVTTQKTLPLKRVAGGPNHLEVYATRSDRRMVVVVRAPTVPLDGVSDKDRDRYLGELQSVADHLGIRTPDGSGFDASDCGHLQFVLEYDKGAGQMGTIVSTAFMLGGVEDEVDDPKPDAAEGDDQDQEERQLAVRTRLVLGNVSLTQSASEKDPLLSISWGWGAKEQIVRF